MQLPKNYWILSLALKHWQNQLDPFNYSLHSLILPVSLSLWKCNNISSPVIENDIIAFILDKNIFLYYITTKRMVKVVNKKIKILA